MVVGKQKHRSYYLFENLQTSNGKDTITWSRIRIIQGKHSVNGSR